MAEGCDSGELAYTYEIVRTCFIAYGALILILGVSHEKTVNVCSDPQSKNISCGISRISDLSMALCDICYLRREWMLNMLIVELLSSPKTIAQSKLLCVKQDAGDKALTKC